MGVFSFHFKYGKEGSIDGYCCFSYVFYVTNGCPNWTCLGPSEQLLRKLRERADGNRVRRGKVHYSTLHYSTVQYSTVCTGVARVARLHPAELRRELRHVVRRGPAEDVELYQPIKLLNIYTSSSYYLHIYSTIIYNNTKLKHKLVVLTIMWSSVKFSLSLIEERKSKRKD